MNGVGGPTAKGKKVTSLATKRGGGRRKKNGVSAVGWKGRNQAGGAGEEKLQVKGEGRRGDHVEEEQKLETKRGKREKGKSPSTSPQNINV